MSSEITPIERHNQELNNRPRSSPSSATIKGSHPSLKYTNVIDSSNNNSQSISRLSHQLSLSLGKSFTWQSNAKDHMKTETLKRQGQGNPSHYETKRGSGRLCSTAANQLSQQLGNGDVEILPPGQPIKLTPNEEIGSPSSDISESSSDISDASSDIRDTINANSKNNLSTDELINMFDVPDTVNE